MEKIVAVFCGRDYGPNKEKYQEMAYTTGRLIAESGLTLASGGGPGMMSDVNEAAMKAGAKRVISIQYGFNEGKQSPFFTESELFQNLVDRQRRLITLADATIALPGGIGTLYEAIQIIALKRSGEIPLEKQMIFVGDGFYDPIHRFLEQIEKEAFITIPVNQLCLFMKTPEEAVAHLKEV